MKPSAVRVGCSGWSYAGWRGRFYPRDLPEAAWFAHYAASFDTVEINNTFYRLPAAATVAQWAAQAPAGFVYSVKAHRFITHMKKLREPRGPLARFLARIVTLGDHLGPLLYQLPPHWRCDIERLRDFLAMLPADRTHVFEFRDASWCTDGVLALLDAHGASFCVHDMDGMDVPRVAVGTVAYVRFHGTQPGYAGGYPPAALRGWAHWLAAQARGGRRAFAYFNNDVAAQAVHDAQLLRRALARLRAA